MNPTANTSSSNHRNDPVEGFLLCSLEMALLCNTQNRCRIQNEIIQTAVERVTRKLKEKDKNDPAFLLQVANCLFPMLSEVQFSSLWVTVLDSLSTLEHSPQVSEIFDRLSEAQMKSASLPPTVLRHLWLAHLPALETAVLSMVQELTKKKLPSLITEGISKSCLAQISNRELVIFQSVFSMLETLAIQTDYSPKMIDIIATFCELTRQSTNHDQEGQFRLYQSRSYTMYNIERFLEDSSSCGGNTTVKNINRAMEEWQRLEAKEKLLKDSESKTGTMRQEAFDSLRYKLWKLAVCHRYSVISTLKHILFCDSQYVPACVWLLVAYHCAQQNQERTIEDIQTCFEDMVLHLRSNMHKPCLKEEDLVPHVSSLEEVPVFRKIRDQLLLAFLFCAPAGFRVGNSILTEVAKSTSPAKQSEVFIYFFQFLDIDPNSWSSYKKIEGKTFVNSLLTKLEMERSEENDDEKSLLITCLKNISV